MKKKYKLQNGKGFLEDTGKYLKKTILHIGPDLLKQVGISLIKNQLGGSVNLAGGGVNLAGGGVNLAGQIVRPKRTVRKRRLQKGGCCGSVVPDRVVHNRVIRKKRVVRKKKAVKKKVVKKKAIKKKVAKKRVVRKRK